MFTERVRRLGLIISMGTIDYCYDTSPMESIWGLILVELLNRQRWCTRVERANDPSEWIPNFGKVTRRYTSIGYLAPVEHDARR
jgi:hypothetical protein